MSPKPRHAPPVSTGTSLLRWWFRLHRLMNRVARGLVSLDAGADKEPASGHAAMCPAVRM